MDMEINKLSTGFQPPKNVQAKDGLQQGKLSSSSATERTDAPQGQDKVELSQMALTLSKISRIADPRPEVTKEAIAQIQNSDLFVPPNLRNAIVQMLMSLFCGKMS
jgi:hypothetical protein